MVKFIIFGKNLFQYTNFDNIGFMFSDVIGDEDVKYISPDLTFGEKWILFWTKHRGFRKWVYYFGVPFRKFAYKSYLKGNIVLTTEDIPVFLFLKNEVWYYGNKGFFSFLKEKYANCKLVYKLTNPVKYVDEKIEDLIINYDLVVVGEKSDAKIYNLPVFDIGFSGAVVDNNDKPHCDCFYIGNSKNRLDIIYEVFDKLNKCGLKLIFYIINVPKEKQIESKNIIYNKALDYDEIIQYVNNAKFVLEVMQQSEETPTLRLMECVAYKKKLITNNTEIVKSQYYDKNNILIFNSADQIDMSFFNDYESCEYPNSEKIGTRYMLNLLKKELNLL